MTLKEIMRTGDAGSISFIESILMAEKINYLIADVHQERDGATRVMIHKSDFERAKELLISTGFKKEIYPLKKVRTP